MSIFFQFIWDRSQCPDGGHPFYFFIPWASVDITVVSNISILALFLSLAEILSLSYLVCCILCWVFIAHVCIACSQYCIVFSIFVSNLVVNICNHFLWNNRLYWIPSTILMLPLILNIVDIFIINVMNRICTLLWIASWIKLVPLLIVVYIPL